MNEAGEATFLRAKLNTFTLETYFLLLDKIFESDVLDSAQDDHIHIASIIFDNPGSEL